MQALDDQLRALRARDLVAPALPLRHLRAAALHRARPALRAERRLLLRVTETDVVRPRD
jgi:hypothetical protein